MENSGIRKEFGKITVDKVEADRYKDSVDSAQLRQVVKKIYPSTSISNSMNDSLFGVEEFGLEGSEYEEIRVTWIPVPKGTTAEQVEAMLAKFPDARIYKILAHEPILTEGQEYALENGLTDLDTFANSQLVQGVDGPILFNDKPQYSVKCFSKHGKEDEDRREAVLETAKIESKTDDLAG